MLKTRLLCLFDASRPPCPTWAGKGICTRRVRLEYLEHPTAPAHCTKHGRTPQDTHAPANTRTSSTFATHCTSLQT